MAANNCLDKQNTSRCIKGHNCVEYNNNKRCGTDSNNHIGDGDIAFGIDTDSNFPVASVMLTE